MRFYIYEWFRKDTNEVIYVGKGCRNRYKCKKKNKMFIWYTENFDCDVRIMEYFNNEDEAFEAESKRIKELKEIKQAFCNIRTSKGGGYQRIWNENKRKRMSIDNPMKRKEQRERMRNQNPMKDKEIALKNGKAHRKKCIIGDKKFDSLKQAGEYFNVTKECIGSWLKKGKTSKQFGNLKCEYDNQQPS